MPRPATITSRILVVRGDAVPAFCQATLDMLRDAERAGAEARALAREAAGGEVLEPLGAEATTK